MPRTYKAVRTDESCKPVRCGHKHHTASAAYRCGHKNLPHLTVVTIEASDGRDLTLADLTMTEAEYRKANWSEWLADIAEYLSSQEDRK